jgi:hypothetical protein
MGLPANIIGIMGKSIYDADAQAFITAAGITNPTQKSAITVFVLALKSASIWTKFVAIYPMVGGTATTHKYNLKNPLDTNAAFRLSFLGGWTHSSTGALPNGTNGYADTFLNNNVLGQNNNHISAYSRTDSNISSTLIASWNGLFGTSIYPRQSINTFNFNNNSPSQSNVVNTDSRGFFLNTRRNATQILSQKNTTQTITSNASSTLINTSFKISRTGDANAEYSNRELALISIGDGLTDTEASNFYTAVQNMQISLSRQV